MKKYLIRYTDNIGRTVEVTTEDRNFDAAFKTALAYAKTEDLTLEEIYVIRYLAPQASRPAPVPPDPRP